VNAQELIEMEERKEGMYNVGMFAVQSLSDKFTDRIRDPKRRAAFTTMLGEHLVKVEKIGITY
jgi:hypothetical protein